MSTLTIPRLLWWRLWRELKRRGAGRRESGAFLLANDGGTKVRDFLCYDDLDPHALDSGIVVFHGCGYVPLWEHCRACKRRVLADVHTHPGEWTGQSGSDRSNPMISQPGHLALILPNFAQARWPGLRNVGIHEYLGHHQWKRWESSAGRVRVSLI